MVLSYRQFYPWGEPTRYPEKIIAGTKIHTLREDPAGRWREGMRIDHVSGNRTPWRTVFATGTCEGVQSITIAFDLDMGKIVSVWVDNRLQKDWLIIAKNDGMTADHFEWAFYSRRGEDGLYRGKIVHFTTLKY